MAEGFWFLAFVSAIPAAIASFPLERRRQASMPDTLPYTWGLYLGLSTLLFGALWVAAGVYDGARDSALNSEEAAWIAPGLVYLLAGSLTLRRRRVGLILSIVFSLNLLWWGVGFVFVKERWGELGSAHRGDEVVA